MKIEFTYEKCGRGDRAKGQTKTVVVDNFEELEEKIIAESRQYLASRTVEASVNDLRRTFAVYGGIRAVGGGTWEVLDWGTGE